EEMEIAHLDAFTARRHPKKLAAMSCRRGIPHGDEILFCHHMLDRCIQVWECRPHGLYEFGKSLGSILLVCNLLVASIHKVLSKDLGGDAKISPVEHLLDDLPDESFVIIETC